MCLYLLLIRKLCLYLNVWLRHYIICIPKRDYIICMALISSFIILLDFSLYSCFIVFKDYFLSNYSVSAQDINRCCWYNYPVLEHSNFPYWSKIVYSAVKMYALCTIFCFLIFNNLFWYPILLQNYSRDLFLFLYFLLIIVSAMTSFKVHQDKSSFTGKSILYLNRHQTEEWKGWMQVFHGLSSFGLILVSQKLSSVNRHNASLTSYNFTHEHVTRRQCCMQSYALIIILHS